MVKWKKVYSGRYTLPRQNVGHPYTEWEAPGYRRVVSFYRGLQCYRLMSGRIIPTLLEKGWDFQELGHHPLFGHLWSALELLWCLWVCYLVCRCIDIVRSVYWGSRPRSQLSTVLNLVGSNQFMSSMAIILLKVVPWPFPVSQGLHVYTGCPLNKVSLNWVCTVILWFFFSQWIPTTVLTYPLHC